MLQKLNERIQGVVAWVIIILIALTFTLFGVDYYLQSHNRTSVSVEVNGEPIAAELLDAQYRRLRQQQDIANLTPEKDKELKQRVLDELVMNEVSVQSAKNNGFYISVEQANAVISAIPQFQEDGKFSLERYQQTISRALYTTTSFLDQVKQGMLLNQVRFSFMGTAFVLPSEVKRFIKLSLQERDYKYLSIPYQNFIDSIKVTTQQIQDYYEKHSNDFLAPEALSVNYIRLSTKDILKSISVSTQDVTRFYNDNISSFKTPAQWRVAQIYFAFPQNASEKEKQNIHENAVNTWKIAVNKPKVFKALVQKHSDDKLSLANNGVLPWITAGQTSMDSSLVTLKAKDDISKPFRSEKGYHIFKLIDYKPATTEPLSAVKAQIKQQLISDALQAKYAESVEIMTELAFQSPDSLQPISKALGLPIESSAIFTKKGSEEKFLKSKKIVAAAFSHDVLSLGNNSEPVQINNDEVIVLRVNKHTPAHERPLKDVSDKIAQTIKRKAAIKKVEKLGRSIINGDITIEKARLSYPNNDLLWKKITRAQRDFSKPTSEINAFAFTLARPGAIMGTKMASGNFLVVKLDAIKDGNPKNLDSEQKAALSEQLESNYAVADYDLYVAALMAKATIKRES